VPVRQTTPDSTSRALEVTNNSNWPQGTQMNKNPLIPLLLPAVFSLLGGCASLEGTRLYPGNVRPANEVALILSADHVTRIARVDAREGEPAKNVFTQLSFEVDPGRYSFVINHWYQGYNTLTVGTPAIVTVDLAPGHKYVLYGKENDRQKTWHPVFVDIGSYHQEDCGGGCSDRGELQAMVDEHFRGARRAMTPRSGGEWR
jgi:hypothetical protein